MDYTYRKDALIREESFVVVNKEDVDGEGKESKPNTSVPTNFHFSLHQKEYGVSISPVQKNKVRGFKIMGEADDVSRCHIDMATYMSSIESDTIQTEKDKEVLGNEFQLVLNQAFTKHVLHGLNTTEQEVHINMDTASKTMSQHSSQLSNRQKETNEQDYWRTSSTMRDPNRTFSLSDIRYTHKHDISLDESTRQLTGSFGVIKLAKVWSISYNGKLYNLPNGINTDETLVFETKDDNIYIKTNTHIYKMKVYSDNIKLEEIIREYQLFPAFENDFATKGDIEVDIRDGHEVKDGDEARINEKRDKESSHIDRHDNRGRDKYRDSQNIKLEEENRNQGKEDDTTENNKCTDLTIPHQKKDRECPTETQEEKSRLRPNYKAEHNNHKYNIKKSINNLEENENNNDHEIHAKESSSEFSKCKDCESTNTSEIEISGKSQKNILEDIMEKTESRIKEFKDRRMQYNGPEINQSQFTNKEKREKWHDNLGKFEHDSSASNKSDESTKQHQSNIIHKSVDELSEQPSKFFEKKRKEFVVPGCTADTKENVSHDPPHQSESIEKQNTKEKSIPYLEALKSPTSTTKPPPRPPPSGSTPVSSVTHGTYTCYTPEGLTIRVYQADIFQLRVDSIVHPDSNTSNVTDKTKVGKAFTMVAGNLKYKCVIKAVAPCWKDYQPHTVENVMSCREDLKLAVVDALKVANQLSMSSIAVPGIGSEIHGVPKDICAMQYAEAVKAFSHSLQVHYRILKEVHFVDQNTETIDLIIEAFKVMVEKKQPAPWNWKIYCSDYPAAAGASSSYASDQFSSVPYFIEDRDSIGCKFTPTKMVAIEKGDILSFYQADAIVCSEDPTGQAAGAVARLLQDRGGPAYRAEKQRLFTQRKLQSGDVIVTQGGDTGYKWIIHAIMPHIGTYNKDEGKWERDLAEMLREIFDTVDKRGFQTVVMSLLGAGAGGSDPTHCARVLIESFDVYCVFHPDTVLYLHVVNNDDNRNQIVIKLFKDHVMKIKAYSASPTKTKQPLQKQMKPVSASSSGGKSGTLIGNQPDGCMTIEVRSFGLYGHRDCKTIIIMYNLSGGKQSKSHPRPGKSYPGIQKRAYLPDNKAGREVCTLLKVAFQRRLVFTIGKSRTTGEEEIRWNGIQHKTDVNVNAKYGYPDAGYLDRVKHELAMKGINKSDPDFDKLLLSRLNSSHGITEPIKVHVPCVPSKGVKGTRE